MIDGIVIQSGGVGGGRLICTGTDHYWVMDEHEKHNVERERHVGPCRNPEQCKAQAEALKKSQQPKS